MYSIMADINKLQLDEIDNDVIYGAIGLVDDRSKEFDY